ncbi:MAG: hypothetical protein LUE26_07395, partial [Alistipes sp.]|nr:hypothetical protein [Alistipes sp.]
RPARACTRPRHEWETVASSAFLVIDRRPPGPAFPDGDTGTVLNVQTLPGYRRRGMPVRSLPHLSTRPVNRG